MNLIEKLEIHNELNPAIWVDNLLRPDVEEKIYDIVDEFLSNLLIEITPIDILLVGSNASFNYTDESDLDIHIIVNYELLDKNTELLLAYFNSEKFSFDDNYDITIHGIPVEIYVLNVTAGITSNGIYSLYQLKWIKFPKPLNIKISPETEALLELSVATWSAEIPRIINRKNIEEITNTINLFYMLRKNSIAVDGEYGFGNLLFKAIRNSGLLSDLKEARIAIKSKELTLENLKILY